MRGHVETVWRVEWDHPVPGVAEGTRQEFRDKDEARIHAEMIESIGQTPRIFVVGPGLFARCQFGDEW